MDLNCDKTCPANVCILKHDGTSHSFRVLDEEVKDKNAEITERTGYLSPQVVCQLAENNETVWEMLVRVFMLHNPGGQTAFKFFKKPYDNIEKVTLVDVCSLSRLCCCQLHYPGITLKKTNFHCSI